MIWGWPSTVEKRGLEFRPPEESFQPSFFPVTSYITATKVHQLSRPVSSRGCQNRRWKHSGCVVSSSQFTWRKLSKGRSGGLETICPKSMSKLAEWELHWLGKLVLEQSPLSLTFRVYKMSVIIQHNIVEHVTSEDLRTDQLVLVCKTT